MSAGQTGHMKGQMGYVHGTDVTHTKTCPAKIIYVYCFFCFFPHSLGRCEGSSIAWVAKFKGDTNSECKLSNGRSRSYREIKIWRPG